MSKLASQIKELHVDSGSLAIFWLAQAGFVYKTPGGTIVYVDAYLSDCVHRLLSDVLYGFKRIMPAPLAPEEVEADVVVCTHSHPDHFDYDAIPVLAAQSQDPICRRARLPRRAREAGHTRGSLHHHPRG